MSERFVLLGISYLKRCSRSVLVLVNQNRQQVCIKSLHIAFTGISSPSSIFRDKALFLSEVWGQWLALARPRGEGELTQPQSQLCPLVSITEITTRSKFLIINNHN